MQSRIAFVAGMLALASVAAGQMVPGPLAPHQPGPPALGHAAAHVARAPLAEIAGAFAPVADSAPGLTLSFDLPALAAQAARSRAFVVRRFPVAPGRFVDLEVERFRITTGRSRFVVGAQHGADQSSGFDPEGVVLLRGRVAGYPMSNVYLGLADIMSTGTIDLGPGAGIFGVSSVGDGFDLGPRTLSVRPVSGGGAAAGWCTVRGATGAGPGDGVTDGDPRRGLRQVELAVDTDLEFFSIFGDVNATNTYILQLYGAVSDVFMREINTRVDLVYTRVWTTPSPIQPDLFSFAGYWAGNMQSVHRDIAQMFSGRADKPGGTAYLPGICSGSAYSFCGNAQGIVEPQGTGPWRHDLLVAAHELGHNLGTGHTHDYGLDNCGSGGATPQRGTIMSYCSQTVSGGMTVVDMAFHTRTRRAMLEVMAPATNPNCLVYDCNQNGLSDAIDIAVGTSLDINASGIPDECEDCNGNSVLDPADIASGTSLDLNNNGLPDECEPDCNNNDVPDDRDILLGTSLDPRGDGVPDECEPDLDNNDTSDLNQIHASMPLDKNRNRTLDAVEDCDADTIPDLTELDAAHDVWVSGSGQGGQLRRFHAVTGVLMATSEVGVLQGYDLLITPDRRVLVSGFSTDRVVEFDHLGVLVGDLVPPGAGGLDGPAGLLISPAGTLLVASRVNNKVIEYDLATGAYLRDFVDAGAGGLAQPFGMAFGPDGLLYITTGDRRVLRYNASTGAFVSEFVAPQSGTLRGLLFKPDGNLLVAGSGGVRQYHGTTGALLGVWAITGVAFQEPWALRLARNGNVLVSASAVSDSHVTRARIHEFNIKTGFWMRGYVLGADTGLTGTTGFDLMPDAGTDCNNNQRPDNCDIAGGYSLDVNSNGVPDECEHVCYPDCNGDGALNLADFGCFQTKFALGDPYADCNGDGVRNLSDFGCFQTKFALGCP